jgi:steroid delta-isomerase-like uncharacterized protein
VSSDQSVTGANKSLIERCYSEMFNPAAWSRMSEFAAPDVVAHAPVQAPRSGVMRVIGLLEVLRTAFPDRRLQTELMTPRATASRSGPRCTARISGITLAFHPIARRVAVDEHGIYRIVDGKIREAWFMPNLPSAMRQPACHGPPPRPLRLLMSLFSGGDETSARGPVEVISDDAWRARTPSSPQAAANKEHFSVASRRSGRANNWSFAGELYALDLVVHVPNQSEPIGLEGLRQRFEMLHGAFPDLQLTVQDVVAENDVVVSRWTLTGTQQGPYFGLPPSGRRVVMSTIDLFRFEDGRLKELWMMPDAVGGLQQIGAVPAGPPSKALIAIMGLGQRFKALLTPRRA